MSRLDAPPAPAAAAPAASPSWIDRTLRAFGDVQAGEGLDVLRMFLCVFLLLVAYYVLKTVREPLILATGGAELKTYAAAAQAIVLLFYVPVYGTLAAQWPVDQLVRRVVWFFVACIQVFFLAGRAGLPYVGFAFYVWVGIFSLTLIAQFWSFANDIYNKPEGDRLFPLIAVGSTAGAPLGAAVAEELFSAGVTPWIMLQIAAGILLLHAFLYRRVRKRRADAGASAAPAKAGGSTNGFALVLTNTYLRRIALLLVLLNIVNTTGEYILASLVTARAGELAAGNPDFSKGAYIGAFYGSYFLWVNVASVTLQLFVVSRIVKKFGIAGALFALPVVALGAYGLAVAGAGIGLVRWVKTAENATDYSVMNTAKQMLWLPTTREQKYAAKQAIDTFFVRSGDMLSAAVVFAGTHWLGLTAAGFAATNLVFLALAFLLGVLLMREYRRVTAAGTAH